MDKYFIKNDFGELRDKFYDRFGGKRADDFSDSFGVIMWDSFYNYRLTWVSEIESLLEEGYTQLTLEDFKNEESKGKGEGKIEGGGYHGKACTSRRNQSMG